MSFPQQPPLYVNLRVSGSGIERVGASLWRFGVSEQPPRERRRERAHQTLPDAKADETTAEFTRRARALPRQQPTGTFSPVGKLDFFFKLLGSSV